MEEGIEKERERGERVERKQEREEREKERNTHYYSISLSDSAFAPLPSVGPETLSLPP